MKSNNITGKGIMWSKSWSLWPEMVPTAPWPTSLFSHQSVQSHHCLRDEDIMHMKDRMKNLAPAGFEKRRAKALRCLVSGWVATVEEGTLKRR